MYLVSGGISSKNTGLNAIVKNCMSFAMNLSDDDCAYNQPGTINGRVHKLSIHSTTQRR